VRDPHLVAGRPRLRPCPGRRGAVQRSRCLGALGRTYARSESVIQARTDGRKPHGSIAAKNLFPHEGDRLRAAQRQGAERNRRRSRKPMCLAGRRRSGTEVPISGLPRASFSSRLRSFRPVRKPTPLYLRPMLALAAAVRPDSAGVTQASWRLADAAHFGSDHRCPPLHRNLQNGSRIAGNTSPNGHPLLGGLGVSMAIDFRVRLPDG
jgi:hypothetical protein